MLAQRPDAQELLDLLDFHPPDWRRHYENLWTRYPTLAGDWVHVGFLNLPTISTPEQPEKVLSLQRWVDSLNRQSRDSLILAELRGKALALMAKRGAGRARAQRALDRRLDELGLRPRFPGGTHVSKSERPAMRKRYQELRGLIDELRTAAADAIVTDRNYRLALLIRFPLLTEVEIDLLFRYPYPRRGATADAAMALLGRRFNLKPDTLNRYLFPR